MSNSVTPWTMARQISLSMEFSKQEYWSGLPFPSPGDLLDSGMEPRSLTSSSLARGFFTTVTPGKQGCPLNLLRWVHIFCLLLRLIDSTDLMNGIFIFYCCTFCPALILYIYSVTHSFSRVTKYKINSWTVRF